MGLRAIRRDTGHLIGHWAVLRLYWKQAEFDGRVPNGR